MVTERKQLSEELKRIEEDRGKLTSLKAKMSERQSEITREHEAFQKRIAPIQQKITGLNDEIQSAKSSQSSRGKVYRQFEKTADPAIEEQIKPLQQRHAELNKRLEHLRSYGVRKPIDPEMIQMHRHLRPGDTKVDQEATTQALNDVQEEFNEVNAQVEALNLQKFDWKNFSL